MLFLIWFNLDKILDVILDQLVWRGSAESGGGWGGGIEEQILTAPPPSPHPWSQHHWQPQVGWWQEKMCVVSSFVTIYTDQSFRGEFV